MLNISSGSMFISFFVFSILGLLLDLLFTWGTLLDRRFDRAMGGGFGRAPTGVLWPELANVSMPNASSSADVSDSGWLRSFHNDTMLSVDETKYDCSASGTWPFAAIISSSRFSLSEGVRVAGHGEWIHLGHAKIVIAVGICRRSRVGCIHRKQATIMYDRSMWPYKHYCRIASPGQHMLEARVFPTHLQHHYIPAYVI